MVPNFTLITEVLPLLRRSFYLADADILNPNNSNPLYDGEFLELDANYKLVRGTGIATVPSWPVWNEKGRYDTQAIGKTTVLFGGPYEADTRVCNATGLAVGDKLMLSDVTVDSLTKKGLLEATTGERMIFGYVTRLPSTGVVRFLMNPPNVQSVP